MAIKQKRLPILDTRQSFTASIHNVSDIELNLESMMWLAGSCLIVQ